MLDRGGSSNNGEYVASLDFLTARLRHEEVQWSCCWIFAYPFPGEAMMRYVSYASDSKYALSSGRTRVAGVSRW